MFTPDFYESLRIMGLGMAGIFTVVAIFYITILALNKFLPPDKE
jgi:hypothetical protein